MSLFSTRFLRRPLRALLLAVTTSALLACGGADGTVASDREGGVRSLSPEFASRKAIAYSPFRTAANESGLDAEAIPKANIEQDLRLLQAADFGLIRVFSSSDKLARQTLEVIREKQLDIKMQLGMWIQGGDDASNQAEIARGVALAQEFSDIVLAVSVGNEALVSWSRHRSTPADMAGYLRNVRTQIAQPVTTNDNWAFYANAPRAVLDTIDYVAVHTYPNLDSQYNPDLWDWKQEAVPEAQRAAAMMDAAIASAKREFQAVRNHLDSKRLESMPIVIGETGWNALDKGAQAFRAHPVNQKLYLDRLNAWVADGRAGNGPMNVFYFQGFDEPWKQNDDGWGLFNKDRQARYAMQQAFPDATWAKEAGSYTDADAVYYKPIAPNAAITTDTYTIFSNAPVGTSDQRTDGEGLTWNAWENGITAEGRIIASDAAPNDGADSLEITPTPQPWGWGFAHGGLPSGAANLSQYAANGKLKFWIKSNNYPGQLEVGVRTGTASGGAVDAYVKMQTGDFGHCNNNTWCQVTIPLSTLLANNQGDLSYVLDRFVIADRYELTGKAQGTANLPKVLIDGIQLTKN